MGVEGGVRPGFMTAVRRTLTWAALGTLLLVWASCGDGHRGVGGFDAPPVPEPTYRFGVVWDSLVVDSGQVKSGQACPTFSTRGHCPARWPPAANSRRRTTCATCVPAASGGWRRSPCGTAWQARASRPNGSSTSATPRTTPSSLADTLGVKLGSYPVDTVYARAVGSIESSLYLDLEKGGHPTNRGVHGQRVRLDHRLQPGPTGRRV